MCAFMAAVFEYWRVGGEMLLLPPSLSHGQGRMGLLDTQMCQDEGLQNLKTHLDSFWRL